MEIISAICEVHPQLRIANLYIRLSSPNTTLNAASVVDNSICLEDGANARMLLEFPVSIKLLDNYKFKPVIDGDYIHLRLPIGVPKGMKSGSENVEVLDLSALSTNTYKSQGKIFCPIIGKEYRLQCAECQSVLVDRVHFKRVLPLPRASWSEAASDWYCHLHAGETSHQKLVPRTTDCLYGSCYHALTASLLTKGSLESTGKESLCSKCQSSVGLMGDDLWNVWCHSIKWSVLEDNNQWKVAQDAATPLQAFYLTLYDALEEEKSFFGRKLAFRDGLGGGQNVLLWFVGDNGFTLDSGESVGGTELQLRRSGLHKVLYKSENSISKKIPSDVSEYQVSREMMESALAVLRNSSNQLPIGCRTAAGFSVGFLSLAS